MQLLLGGWWIRNQDVFKIKKKAKIEVKVILQVVLIRLKKGNIFQLFLTEEWQ